MSDFESTCAIVAHYNQETYLFFQMYHMGTISAKQEYVEYIHSLDPDNTPVEHLELARFVSATLRNPIHNYMSHV